MKKRITLSELKLAIAFEYLYTKLAKPGQTRREFYGQLDFRIIRNAQRGRPETTKLNWRGYTAPVEDGPGNLDMPRKVSK